MTRYECQLCGYVYDPAEGDSTNEIDSGTAFDELPEDCLRHSRSKDTEGVADSVLAQGEQISGGLHEDGAAGRFDVV